MKTWEENFKSNFNVEGKKLRKKKKRETRNDAIVTNDISSFDVVRLLATTVLIPIKKLRVYGLLLLRDPIDIRSHVLPIRRFVINRGDRG